MRPYTQLYKRRIAYAVGLAVLAFMAPAGVATAAERSKKSRVQKMLLRQVMKNPAIVKNRRFTKMASAASFELPVTVRFNRCLADAGAVGTCSTFDTANDTIDLDLGRTLGNVGNESVTIQNGVLQLWASFGDPRNGDKPGDINVSNKAFDGSRLVTALTLSGVGVLANEDVQGAPASFIQDAITAANGQSQTIGANGCSDIAGPTLRYGVTAQEAANLAGLSPGNGQLWSDYAAPFGSLDSLDPSSQPNIPSSISDDIVFRTAPILARVDSVRGDVNLFSGNVDVTVNTTVSVNSVFRVMDNESPLHCAEVITGASESSDVAVNARGSNSLEVDPGITIDNKLRLVNVNLGRGPVSRPEIKACLAPLRPFGVQVTELTGQFIDLLSTDVAASTGTVVGVDDLQTGPAIASVASTFGASSTTADFRRLNGSEPRISCGAAPAPLYNDGVAYQFNILADRLLPMEEAANHVVIRPEVSVRSISGEGLIGHFSE